jgi:hypothetical protein
MPSARFRGEGITLRSAGVSPAMSAMSAKLFMFQSIWSQAWLISGERGQKTQVSLLGLSFPPRCFD